MTSQGEREKRKEILRKLGIRQLPPVPVPRHNRGPDYLVAHACFDCRCSFKLKWTYIDLREAPCPNCRRPMAWMGRNFKAPRRSDLRQWKKVAALWNAGVRFAVSNGRDKPPQTMQDVASFLGRRHERDIADFRAKNAVNHAAPTAPLTG